MHRFHTHNYTCKYAYISLSLYIHIYVYYSFHAVTLDLMDVLFVRTLHIPQGMFVLQQDMLVLQCRRDMKTLGPSVALCCIVLQCVAMCCNVFVVVWQCVAVCCSVLQCVAVCCSVLQCAAVCCSVLQCVAVCCSAVVTWWRWVRLLTLCHVTHSYERNDASICVTRHAFICQTWRINKCDRMLSDVYLGAFICVIWCFHMYALWSDAYMCVTRRRHMCKRWVHLLMCVTGLIHMYDMTLL